MPIPKVSNWRRRICPYWAYEYAYKDGRINVSSMVNDLEIPTSPYDFQTKVGEHLHSEAAVEAIGDLPPPRSPHDLRRHHLQRRCYHL